MMQTRQQKKCTAGPGQRTYANVERTDAIVCPTKDCQRGPARLEGVLLPSELLRFCFLNAQVLQPRTYQATQSTIGLCYPLWPAERLNNAYLWGTLLSSASAVKLTGSTAGGSPAVEM